MQGKPHGASFPWRNLPSKTGLVSISKWENAKPTSSSYRYPYGQFVLLSDKRHR